MSSSNSTILEPTGKKGSEIPRYNLYASRDLIKAPLDKEVPTPGRRPEHSLVVSWSQVSTVSVRNHTETTLQSGLLPGTARKAVAGGALDLLLGLQAPR